MTIENKRVEITRLIDNIKMHSDALSDLETIPVLEIGVILSKIKRLHDEAAVLKYLCEVQQGKKVDILSSDLVVTDIKEGSVRTPEIQPKIETEELEETALLDEKEEDTEDALAQMYEAAAAEEESIQIEEIEEVEEKENVAPEVISEEEELEEIVEEVVNFSSDGNALNEALLDQILEQAKDDENQPEEIESLVEKLESDSELSSKPDLNEALSSEDSSVSNQLQQQPILDLMSAIGLNERYLYSNELFGGDMDEFKSAVKLLNEFDSGEEAKAFFENGLRSTYSWEDDNTLAHALLNLVERRYL